MLFFSLLWKNLPVRKDILCKRAHDNAGNLFSDNGFMKILSVFNVLLMINKLCYKKLRQIKRLLPPRPLKSRGQIAARLKTPYSKLFRCRERQE